MPRVVVLLLGSLAISTVSAQSNFDEEEKLRALERAMQTSPEPGVQPEHKQQRRTRAIVFENEGQEQQPSAPAANQDARYGYAPPPPPSRAIPPMDCAGLPSGVRSVAVDFSIQFRVGSAVVSPASERTLNQIARILALSPERCVIVEGHTDATGNYERNIELSHDRANSVVNFISERNRIDRRRLVPVGKGSSSPLDNLDARDPRNRRVVFKVVTG